MTASEHSLVGKVAVVTGAGRGIGRAIALGFAEAGAMVCCTARTESQIAATAARIEESGGRAIARCADVTDWPAMQAVFADADAAFGGVDIVVANAGASLARGTVAETDPAAWSQTIAVNLCGTYHTVKAALPYLQRRGAGKIILTGSGIGHRGGPGHSAYACSKAGLWMLTRVLAQELYDHNISVNELIPGPVITKMTGPRAAALRARLGESEWIKKPEDVVPLALFLATQPDVGPTAQSFSLMRRDN